MSLAVRTFMYQVRAASKRPFSRTFVTLKAELGITPAVVWVCPSVHENLVFHQSECLVSLCKRIISKSSTTRLSDGSSRCPSEFGPPRQ